jgi:hypothetical protein
LLGSGDLSKHSARQRQTERDRAPHTMVVH